MTAPHARRGDRAAERGRLRADGGHPLARPDEVAHWLDSVQAGNLYVNRGITGAIVRRQPFGGWKRSSVGTGAKAGGPNYAREPRQLDAGRQPRPRRPRARRPRPRRSRRVIDARRSPRSTSPSSTACAAPRTATRRPGTPSSACPATSRPSASSATCSATGRRRSPSASPTASPPHLVRLLAAAARAGSTVHVSSSVPLPTPLVQSLRRTSRRRVRVRDVAIESDAAFLARAQAGQLATDRGAAHRRRPRRLSAVLGGNPDVAIWSRPGHDVGPRRAAAVPARAEREHHGAPVRQPRHGDGGAASLVRGPARGTSSVGSHERGRPIRWTARTCCARSRAEMRRWAKSGLRAGPDLTFWPGSCHLALLSVAFRPGSGVFSAPLGSTGPHPLRPMVPATQLDRFRRQVRARDSSAPPVDWST